MGDEKAGHADDECDHQDGLDAYQLLISSDHSSTNYSSKTSRFVDFNYEMEIAHQFNRSASRRREYNLVGK